MKYDQSKSQSKQGNRKPSGGDQEKEFLETRNGEETGHAVRNLWLIEKIMCGKPGAGGREVGNV